MSTDRKPWSVIAVRALAPGTFKREILPYVVFAKTAQEAEQAVRERLPEALVLRTRSALDDGGALVFQMGRVEVANEEVVARVFACYGLDVTLPLGEKQ